MPHTSDTVITVSSQQELDDAYQKLANGEGGKIVLEAGPDYKMINWDPENINADAAVTITSEDPNTPANFSYVRLTGSDNLTFEDVSFSANGGDVAGSGNIVEVNHSKNVVFRDVTFSSDADAPYGTQEGNDHAAKAMIVRSSESITIEDSLATNLDHAFMFMNSRDIRVTGNELTQLQGDGLRIGGVTGLLIEGNSLHDFIGTPQSANHSDMIQIWGTNATVNNKDITIRGNLLDTGNGARYQMIFGHNEEFEKNGFLFENIVIEENVIFGAHQHSISLNDTIDTVVRNNTVIYNQDAYTILDDGTHGENNMTGGIMIGGEGAVVENNISPSVNGVPGNHTLVTTSPFLSEDFRSHFINIEAGGSGDFRDLMLRPDSPLNGVAGASSLWWSDTADTLMAIADVSVKPSDRSVFTLDASLSKGPDGLVADQGATFTWTFANGVEKHGPKVEHDFGDVGDHDYTLTVTMPDGRTDEIERSVKVSSPLAFHYIFTEDAGAWLEIGNADEPSLERWNDDLFNLNDFNIGLKLERDPGESGDFLHLPETMRGSVDEEGFVTFELTTDEGTFTLVSGTAVFADDKAHDLSFVLDSSKGSLALLVDGTENASLQASGMTPDRVYWGLTVGSAWNEGLHGRVQELYLITEPRELAEVLEELDPETAPEPGLPGASEESLRFEDGEIVSEVLDYDLESGSSWTDAGLDITKGQLTFTRDNEQLYNADSFGIGFDMVLNEGADSGTIFYLHETLEIEMTAAGELNFELFTSQGAERIGTVGLDIEDGAFHRVSVEYDSEAGLMQILVDGNVVAQGQQSGTTAEVLYWGLTTGHPWHPWGDHNANVTIDNISLRDSADLGVMPIGDDDTQGDRVVTLDFDGGEIRDSSGNGTAIRAVGRDVEVLSNAERDGYVELGKGKAAIEVLRTEDDLYEQDSFIFDLDLRSDGTDGRTAFGIHNAMQLDEVDDELVFTLHTSEGDYQVASTNGALADDDWHDVQVAYSDAAGQLQLRVDGEVVDSVAAQGTTMAREYWGLTLGNKWGGGFEGAIDDFTYATNVGEDAFDVGAGMPVDDAGIA